MGHRGESEDHQIDRLVTAWRAMPALERGDLMRLHPEIAGPLAWLTARARIRLALD